MRSMVEGPTLATIHDKPHGYVQISQDISRSNSQRLEPQLSQRRIPPFVPLRPVACVMGFTIYFDCQTTVETSEVCNVAADGKLPPESQAAGSLAKLLPEKHLGQRHFAAKLASEFYVVGGSSNGPVPDPW